MRTRSTTAPLGLRLVHATVFLGLAVIAVLAAREEWQHLLLTLRQPYTTGDQARLTAVLAGAVAIACGLWLVGALLTRRSAPSFVSLLIGLSLVFAGASAGRAEERPTPMGVNLALLEATRGVQHELGSRLQREGVVPDTAAFASALAATRAGPNFEVRDRRGRVVPVRIVEVKDRDGSVAPVPGQVWLLKSRGGGAFALRPVGLGPDGRALPLVDDQGRALWLEASFQLSGPLVPEDASP